MVPSKFLCVATSGCLKVAHKNVCDYKYQLDITYFHSALITDHKRELALLTWIMVVIFFPKLPVFNFDPLNQELAKMICGPNAAGHLLFCTFCDLFFTFLNGCREKLSKRTKFIGDMKII